MNLIKVQFKILTIIITVLLLFVFCSKKDNEIKKFDQNKFGVLIANYGEKQNNKNRIQTFKDTLNYYVPRARDSLKIVDERYKQEIEIEKTNKTIIPGTVATIGQENNVSLFILLKKVSEDTIQIFIARKDISYEIADSLLLIVQKPDNEKYRELINNVISLYKLSISLKLQKDRKFAEAADLLNELTPLSTKNNKKLEIKDQFMGNLYLKEAAALKKEYQSSTRDSLIKKAKENFKNSIKDNPENPNPYFNLGYIAAAEEGKLEEAIKRFEKAYSKKKDEYRFCWNLALAYVEQGDRVRAVQILDEFLKNYGDKISSERKGEMERLLNDIKNISSF